MKKHKIIIAALSLALTGCSAPAASTSGNNSEIESLKAQIEELSKENELLKEQLDSTPSPEETEIAETADTSAEISGSTLAIGEEGTLGDWSIMVTNAEITDSIKESNYYGFNPEDGNKYLAIDITVTNNGKNASNFLPSFGLNDDISAKILYQGDYEFSATQLLGYSKELHDTSVNPLSTKSGIVAFELPDSVASVDEELVLVISAGKNSLQFKVR